MGDLFDLFRQIGRQEEPAGKPEWLIVGLGNPGKEYEKTRHNAGFMAMDRLCARLGTSCLRSRFRSLTGDGVMGAHRVLLMKPQTYMNLSGEAVRDAAAYYKIPPERILVLSDDVYLPTGRMRIRTSGSNGGHNGLGNIIYQLESDRFPRIRLGVGEKPHPDYDMKDWVLGRLPENEWSRFSHTLDDVFDAAVLVMDGKSGEAMGRYNGKVYLS